jgi:Rrf2 family protein
MFFSKTFSYALRSVLYIAVAGENREKIQLDEIARKLAAPRHFLGKVMRRMAKEGIVSSVKGPHGGFYINKGTLDTTLLKLITVTGEAKQLDYCIMDMKKCNPQNPCPLHVKTESIQKQWSALLANTTIASLLSKDPDFIRSLSAT